MLLALGATAIVLAALLWELSRPRLHGAASTVGAALARARARRRERAWSGQLVDYDPGRELRAEQRARALLRSCVNEEEWAMYRDLGFLRVFGGPAHPGPAHPGPAHPGPAHPGPAQPPIPCAQAGSTASAQAGSTASAQAGSTASALAGPIPAAQAGSAAARPGLASADSCTGDPALAGATAPGAACAPYAYLIYPHRPIVAYLPQTGALLNEYCVAFPDHSRPYGSARLPDADDTLAKWMALTADERRLIADANMHLPGRQLDPEQVREDLARLARWERERVERSGLGLGSVRAS